MAIKNLFIVFEGIDGSGKSTQVQFLAQNLHQHGHKVFCTSEPTNNEIGLLLRKIFTHQIQADHRTIAALFVADRLHHLLDEKEGILQKLKQGFTVINDRYYFSSYAYQGAHVPLPWAISANSLCADILKPDLNIFIDISPEESIYRIRTSRNQIDLYETIDNLTAVRNKYFEVFDLFKLTENIFITDGMPPQKNISDTIWEEVKKYL